GTIFLDEIGELPLDTQSYLLRVLESGEFIRVGSSAVMHTDVRIVAATNVDLYDRVEKGKFRRELYYRLNTVPIVIPPLRELRYQWPGNVRELKNVADQLSIMSERRTIDEDDLLEVLPELNQRYLPARTEDMNNSGANLQEREILYKLLFDMKSDLNELKSLVFGLIKENKLDVPDAQKILGLPERAGLSSWQNMDPGSAENQHLFRSVVRDEKEEAASIIIQENQKSHKYFDDSEPVEESLSLEEMEKDMIRKALKKYHGKRKDASEELGISERTLYRKIKQYELE